MMFMMVVSLYTSRVVLRVLGVEDYGIYNVVGGFISVFGFLNGALSTSTSRYITFALGKGDVDKLEDVFSTCRLTHILLAILILVLAETVGLWFMLNKLVIPEERLNAAMWVYQCSVLSTMVFLVSVPYNSCIVAHERMSAFAYISVFETVAKLMIVYMLLIGNLDKLKLYAILILGVQVLIRMVYTIYCHRNFQETNCRIRFNKSLFAEMLSFAGWNLWGNMAAAMFGQGINILLNIFFGPAVNAARGIATQVQAAVQQFSINFQMALNPQITKTYAAGDYSSMHLLIERSSKFTFILLYCLSLPIIIETKSILQIWLGIVPSYAVSFVRLMLIICIIDAIANSLMVGAAASGKVKMYQGVVGGVLLSIVPISYVVLKLGYSPESVFYVHIAVACCAFVSRLILVKPLIFLSISSYIHNVILRCFYVAFISTGLSIILHMIKPENFFFLIVELCLISLGVLVVGYVIGLSYRERTFVNIKVKNFVLRIVR